MKTIECDKKCCQLKVFPYEDIPFFYGNRPKRRKAGVILHCKESNKILVIQSRGNLWGFPKGSFEQGETDKDCAVRELFEETGIQIEGDKLETSYKINSYVTYFYCPCSEEICVEIQEDQNNDASGIGWIDVGCFKELIHNNIISINYHARKCLLKFFSKI